MFTTLKLSLITALHTSKLLLMFYLQLCYGSLRSAELFRDILLLTVVNIHKSPYCCPAQHLSSGQTSAVQHRTDYHLSFSFALEKICKPLRLLPGKDSALPAPSTYCSPCCSSTKAVRVLAREKTIGEYRN